MQIKIGFDIEFESPVACPTTFLLYVHPSRASDLCRPEAVYVEPNVPVQTYVDTFGNRAGRILAPAGRTRLYAENVIRDTGRPDPVPADAIQHAVESLPTDVLPFLMASRYCEVDLLQDHAWDLFGHTPLGWPRVKAVVDWVHGWVTFGYAHARPTKTAYDVFHERRGVCRDFQHLCVTLLRCLNIPARYVTGYLGDIGVPYNPAPMDFSAWHEVYLGGRWWAVDGRHNVPRIGRILMAAGRDAVDVAMTTHFGSTTLRKFTVVTEEVPEG